MNVRRPRAVRLSVLVVVLCPILTAARADDERPPNIVYILADDLGYGELGCYGQEKIRTPNIDRLAAEGMRFTQHYSGSPVCAPSRCVLMTGLHTGHAYIRNNRGKPVVGQEPIPSDTRTVARLLQARGYATACIGKWGLGGPDTTGVPWEQGFDHFFGYLDQWRAHNYHPTYLYRNAEQVPLDNPDFPAHQKLESAPDDPAFYARYRGNDYAPDRMIEEALAFIRERKDGPFFLAFTTPVPHVAIQVPEDSLAAYPEAWDEQPYLGDKGYLPHPRPNAAYAAMITRMDDHVGRLLGLLDELGLAENTIVFFTSDNGPTYAGGVDAAFFASAGPLRGLKGSVFEGGIRVPFLARWPGRVEAGSESDHASAFQDMLPTLVEVAGGEAPADVDGISLLPTLLGEGRQPEHEALYWELGRQQAVRAGDWKLVRQTDRQGRTRTMLFNLHDDVGEQNDLSETHRDELTRMLALARSVRTPSTLFPSVYDDDR